MGFKQYLSRTIKKNLIFQEHEDSHIFHPKALSPLNDSYYFREYSKDCKKSILHARY